MIIEEPKEINNSIIIMKIKEFQIDNFRSINSLNVRVVNNFMQLIGENNSGKTNILLALKLFFSKSSKYSKNNKFDIMNNESPA